MMSSQETVKKCFICQDIAINTYESAEGNKHDFCLYHSKEVKKYGWKFVEWLKKDTCICGGKVVNGVCQNSGQPVMQFKEP